MISDFQSELRENVSGYLLGRLRMDELESWLWPRLGDLQGNADDETRNAAGVVGSVIAEYSYGDRSEESMRRDLAAAIEPSAGGAFGHHPVLTSALD